jgi:hypothetical protein
MSFHEYTADEFMKALRDGEMLIGTDKGYKSYIGEGQKGKFYYENLSREQEDEFILMLNEKKINLEPDFGLYVLPGFVGLKGYTGVKGSAMKPFVYCRRGEELK